MAFLSCDTNADFLGLDDASDGTMFAFFANGVTERSSVEPVATDRNLLFFANSVPERAIWDDFSCFFVRKSESKS